MASIADAILALLKQREEPAVAASMPSPGPTPGPVAPDVAPPPPVTPPVPPETLPAAAPMAEPLAEAYKSPPDLVSMYERLMERSRNAAAMDRGMTLIAAGLAQDQNKEALIRMASSAGGGGTSAPSMTDLINLQKMQQEAQDKAARQAQLPALMKQYNLDPATVQYLDATGQLDDTIQALSTPDTEVVDTKEGKKLINSRTGETIKELSPAPPRATEFQQLGDGSKVLVYSDDKTRVDNGEKLTNIEAPVETEIVHSDADGSNVLVNKKTGENLGTVTPGATPDGDILTRPDGSQALINKKDGSVIKELSGPKELNAEDKDKLATINAERKAKGEPSMTMEEYLKMNKGGVTIYTGENGEALPKPSSDFDWDRTPDGKVKIYPDGPHQHVIPGTKTEQEMKEKAAKIASDKAAADAAAAGAEKAGTAKAVKHTLVHNKVEEALRIIQDNKGSWFGSTGVGALGGYLPFGGSKEGPKALAGALATIKTNVGFDQLQAMRAESKTGSALGPVSDFENQMLQGVLGTLNQFGNDEVLAANLRAVDAATDLIVNGVEDPPGSGKYRTPTQADIDAILSEAETEPIGTTKSRGPIKVERIN